MPRYSEISPGILEAFALAGELPVSGYFWRSVASMESPLDYVSRLSLTFEQANLDFCRHFAQGFKTVGDEATAALLDELVTRAGAPHHISGLIAAGAPDVLPMLAARGIPYAGYSYRFRTLEARRIAPRTSAERVLVRPRRAVRDEAFRFRLGERSADLNRHFVLYGQRRQLEQRRNRGRASSSSLRHSRA